MPLPIAGLSAPLPQRMGIPPPGLIVPIPPVSGGLAPGLIMPTNVPSSLPMPLQMGPPPVISNETTRLPNVPANNRIFVDGKAYEVSLEGIGGEIIF